ncbi:hypothetical protein D3C85_1538080 [compost metagenome]
MGVLEAKKDTGLAELLGLAYIRGATHLHHQVTVLADQFLAGGDGIHRLLEAFPHRNRAIGGGQAAFAHVLKQLTVPFGDDQAIDNDTVVVYFARIHATSPFSMDA